MGTDRDEHNKAKTMKVACLRHILLQFYILLRGNFTAVKTLGFAFVIQWEQKRVPPLKYSIFLVCSLKLIHI